MSAMRCMWEREAKGQLVKRELHPEAIAFRPIRLATNGLESFWQTFTNRCHDDEHEALVAMHKSDNYEDIEQVWESDIVVRLREREEDGLCAWAMIRKFEDGSGDARFLLTKNGRQVFDDAIAMHSRPFSEKTVQEERSQRVYS